MASKEQPITQALLARAHSPDSANRVFTEKIQHRPVYLRPGSPPPANARDARRHAREKQRQQRKKALKPKPLSAQQRRKLGLYNVPREGQKYAVFEPLHELWLGYIREILGGEVYTGGQGAAAKLASADFHGAGVEVVRSNCVGRVGIKGLVVKDARFVFEIITKKNNLKIVPKEGTVFRIEVPAPQGAKGAEGANDGREGQDASQTIPPQDGPRLVFDIHGDQFMYRPADRSNKRFKSHFSKTL